MKSLFHGLFFVFFCILPVNLFAQPFTLNANQVNVALAPGFNHSTIPVTLTPDFPGFDFNSLVFTSDSAWVTPNVEPITGRILLSFSTSGLPTGTYTATITITHGLDTRFLFVTATSSPLNVFKLIDDPFRSRTYGIQLVGTNQGSIVVLDPIAGQPVSNVTVGAKPTGMAISNDGLELFVINCVDKTISVIDLETLQIKQTISLSAFGNWGQNETTANICTGPGNIIYYTDGAWAPLLRVFNRGTGTVLQTLNIDPSSGYGFGDIAVTSDKTSLFGWAQYGWTAGWAGSYVSKYTIAPNGILSFVQNTSSTYPTPLSRDPLETPILISYDDQSVFVKKWDIDPSSITTVKRSFSGDIYSITPGGEIVATSSALFETLTGNKLYDFPFSTSIQTITSDYSRLVLFNSSTRTFSYINLIDTIGLPVMGHTLSPLNGSTTSAPTSLQWSPVPGADTYSIYFGTSLAEVTTATNSSPEYLGQVHVPAVKLPNSLTLTAGTTYYWRVDSITTAGQITSAVYSFTVSSITPSVSEVNVSTVHGNANLKTTVALNSVNPSDPWTATADKPWVTFTQASGVAPGNLEVVLNASNLSAGYYSATITFSNSAGSMFTLPVKLTVDPLKLTIIKSDPIAKFAYAISEDMTSLGTKAYLLEIDTEAQSITRATTVGSSVTDIAIHNPDNRIYVTNWMPGTLRAVDKTTFSQVQTYGFNPFQGTGYGHGDVYRVSAGVAGRLVIEPQDQWITIEVFNTNIGTTLGTAYVRQGGGGCDPTGTYYYHGDDNASNAAIHKYNISGDAFSELASIRVSSYSFYGSRTVVVSESGNGVFWNGSYFDANLTEKWTMSKEIYSTTRDALYAFGDTDIFDTTLKQAVLGMPTTTRVSAFNSISNKLIVQVGENINFFPITSPLTLPAPVLSANTILTTSVGLKWIDSSLETGFTLQYRLQGAAMWTNTQSAPSKNATSATITGLLDYTTYEFRIKADSPFVSSNWSNIITVTTLAIPPAITTQPSNQTVLVDQTATFSVTATGTNPKSYQWRKNGVNISGATGSSYTTPPLLIEDNASTFSVVVSNAGGSVTSNNATLAVQIPPSITIHPAPQTAPVGQTATFTVTASGTAPLTYQWRKNGFVISGATNSSYTTPPTIAGDDGALFKVVVTNTVGTTTSNEAVLTVPTVVATLPTLLPGFKQAAYSKTLQPSGASFNWSIIAGSLPPGLNLSSAGLLSGNPTATGTYNFTVQVTNTVTGTSAQADMSLTIDTNRPCLYFNGVDGFVSIPHANDLNLTGPFTVECWVNANSYHSSNGNDQALVSKDPNDTSRNYFLAWRNSLNKIHFASTIGGWNQVSNTPDNSITTCSWHHVAGVYENNQLKIFIDGSLKTTQTVSGGISVNTVALTIACDMQTNRRFFNGMIREVRISKIARYPNEFTPATQFATDSDTVALLHMDEGFGNTVADSSGANHTGTITGGATWVMDDFIYPVTIINQPAAKTVNLGQTATFNVSVTGAIPLSYQWQKNNVNIPGATNNIYTTPTTTSGDNNALYKVTISNSIGSVTSSSATLTVITPPSITTQPVAQTVYAGQTATFNVSTSGTAPFSYQWKKNGANIVGATNASYTISTIVSGDNGTTYTVTVSNAAGSATSNGALLTVRTITANAQWVGINKNATKNLTLTGTDSQGLPLTFIILTQPSHGVLNGTAPNLTYTPDTDYQGTDSFIFKVNNGSVDSASATVSLSVISIPVDPTGLLGYWPLDGNTLDVSGNGRNGTFVGTPTSITGQMGGAYNFNGTCSIDLGNIPFTSSQYTIAGWIRTTEPGTTTQGIVRAWIGKVDTNATGPFELALGNGLDGTGPGKDGPHYQVWQGGGTIVHMTNPAINLREGNWHHMAVTYRQGEQKIYVDGVLATSNTYSGSLPSTTQNVNIGGYPWGGYHARWIGDVDDVYIFGRVLTAQEVQQLQLPATLPNIITQPIAQTVNIGQTATFSVSTSGATPLAYQWKKNGVNIVGATNASYTTPVTISGDDGALFSVVVSNALGTVTSNTALLTLRAPPTITSQPVTQTINLGQPATFTISATGIAPLTYQWRKNGANISGATNSSYTTPPTINGDHGTVFDVVVSNAFGSTTSVGAVLNVNTPPVITAQPLGKIVFLGETATFSVTASGSAPLSYQWTKNSANIPGATNSSYIPPTPSLSDNGSEFRVIVTNAVGSATSNAAILTVIANPSINNISPATSDIAGGITVTINGINLAGTSSITFGGVPATGINVISSTQVTCVVPAHAQGPVNVYLVTPDGTINSSGVFAYTNILPPSITFQPLAKAVSVGQTATFTVTASGATPLTYQWKKNGTNISGAINPSYTTPPTVIGNNGAVFSVVVSNAYGTATSNGAVLTVVGIPTADGQWVGTSKNQPKNLTLTGNDSQGAPVTYAVVTQPAHGTLSGTAPNLIYTPATDYSGPDSFTFKANNGVLDSSTATVKIGVLPFLVDPTGLLGYWPLDGNAQDASGNGNNGVISGNPISISGYRGNAYKFNGFNFIDVGNIPFSNGQYTVAGWIRTTEPGTTTQGIVRAWIGNVDGGSATGPLECALGNGLDGAGPGKDGPHYQVWQNGGTLVHMTNPIINLRDGNWHHMTVTYRPGEQKVYVDGSLAASNAYSGSLPSTIQAMQIGGVDWHYYHQRWIGDIDDVLVFSRVLSSQEIQQLVPPSPFVTAQLAPQTVNMGQAATFTVFATGGEPLSYQWKKNGVDISGATNVTYTTPITVSGDNGTIYSVFVSNANGSATSNGAILTVLNGPTITAQPTNQNVLLGAKATFTVTATGTGTLKYQWRRNGGNISGATKASYSITTTAATDDGATFSVVVSDNISNATSNSATLTLKYPPVITSQPTSKTVNIGQTATFTVSATGTGTITYQWKKNGTSISGATKTSYTTPAATITDNGAVFTVTVKDTVTSVTSAGATLTVNLPPTITSQPIAQTVNVGQTATFNVTATGPGPLTYQWKKSGVDISGATNTSYTTSPATVLDNGFVYSVVVSNIGGSVTSNGAALIVISPPVIVKQPASQTVNVGRKATFNVIATGPAPLSYQWKKNGLDISGATTTSYLTPTTTLVDEGTQFSVVISNAFGSVTSANAVLSISNGLSDVGLTGTTIGTGSSGYSSILPDGRWQITGTGTGFSATDSLYFEQATQNNNFEVVARIQSFVGGVTRMAGLMIREGLGTSDRMIITAVDLNNLYQTGARIFANTGAVILPSSTTYTYPNAWIGLTREGELVSMFGSVDGTNWTQLGKVIIPGLAQSLNVGLFVLSGDTDTPASAIISDYEVNPITTVLQQKTFISGGSIHSMACNATGDGTPWGWGGNANGQLGTGDINTLLTPVQIPSFGNLASIHGENLHTVAVKKDGTVWTWGYNAKGQLGDNTTTQRNSPIQVAGLSGIISALGGGSHTVALKNDGTVYTWGLNTNGQLGDGSVTQRKTPVQVTGLNNVIAIAIGTNHTMALKSDGTVWAWGNNTNGQLGDGTIAVKTAPVQVSGLSGVIAISCGATHSMALKSDGTLWTWGLNTKGQLGDGTTVQKVSPVQITSLSSIVAISGGTSHSLALKNDGTVYAWGLNSNGQVGDGSTTQRNSPVLLNGFAGVIAVSAGANHSIALKADGKISTWGANASGQLGDGTTAIKTAPTQLTSPVIGF